MPQQDPLAIIPHSTSTLKKSGALGHSGETGGTGTRTDSRLKRETTCFVAPHPSRVHRPVSIMNSSIYKYMITHTRTRRVFWFRSNQNPTPSRVL